MAKKTETLQLDRVRNIGVAAHIDAGKTTLTERILYYTGASHKVGEVHDGAAHMDYQPEEREHGITITSAVTRCPWRDHLIQLIDTPGHVDFTIEVERSMRVLDSAIIVLDGVRGVEPQTETVWRQASRFEIPRVIFVNKMDRPGADFDRAMETVAAVLGGSPVPVTVPLEDGMVLDLIGEQAFTFHGQLGSEVRSGPIPPHAQETFQRHRETMLLAAAEADPELEELVLEEEPIEPEAIRAALRASTMAGRIQPTFGGSALRNWGVQPLLDGVLALLPNPLERPPAIARRSDGEETFVEMTPEGGLVALAFKIQLWGGRRHVFLRLYRGTLEPGQMVRVAGRDTVERVARVFETDASSKKRLKSATAGQLVLISGPRVAVTGDTLCDPDDELILERIDTKEPVLGLAVETESSKDEEKFLQVIGKVCEEDPTLRFGVDAETGQNILKGMGELHLQIVFERLQREFGLAVRAGRPRVMTRETIAGSGTSDVTINRLLSLGEGKEQRLHARARVAVRPRLRDAGTEIAELAPEIHPAGAGLSAAQEEAARAGLTDSAMNGPAEGAPLQDVHVALTGLELFGDDSTPQAIRIAVSQAVREALNDGGAAVLQPRMRIEVVAPDGNLGSVLGDLQARKASIMGQESSMGMTVVHGECPLQNLLGYATSLRSLTKGRGQFSMEFDRFDSM